MTPFKLMLYATRLSNREAAAYLNMSVRTVENNASGKNQTKPAVMEELRDLYNVQRDAANHALAELDRRQLDVLVLGRPSDDQEAQSAGWPCVGAWVGAAAMVIAETSATTRVVPLGSEPATALAADMRARADV